MATDTIFDLKRPATDVRPVSLAPVNQAPMKSDLVEQARTIVPHPPLLINMVSKRVRQLSGGRTALVERRSGMGLADVALTEIIEEKIVITDNGDIEEADDE